MILGVDTETTGLDIFHGCRPYMVTTCDDSGRQQTWQWQVNPKNRQVTVPPSERWEIQQLLDRADQIVFHNAKFDMRAMESVGIKVDHLWGKVEDTLFSAHLLASQEPHDLTSVVKKYLGRDIRPFEQAMEKAVKEARSFCRSHLKNWRLADDRLMDEYGYQVMPSTKGSTETGRAWLADTWLPEVLAVYNGPSWTAAHGPNWKTVTADYADIDSSCLIPLHKALRTEMDRRGLYKIYKERLRILPVIHRMTGYGTSYKLDTHQSMKAQFKERVAELEELLHAIAVSFGYSLVLPKRGRNKNLDKFLFEVLKLPVLGVTEADNPAFDASIREDYEAVLPANSVQQRFIKYLNEKAEFDTALSYMSAYERFCIRDTKHTLLTPKTCDCRENNDLDYNRCPVCDWGLGVCANCGKAERDLDGPCSRPRYATLYPNLNPTGTVGLRFSHTNPNSANVSKHKKTNLRKCFGPRPGRIWYSLDYTNIELIIPAKEVNEEELVYVFDHPEDPPYYGSFHMVMFSALWPEQWDDAMKRFGPEKAAKFCKSEYEDTLYQWTKNFDFATQYGCQEKKANVTAHHPNAFKMKAERCPKIDRLAADMIRMADKLNYVTTIPDKEVDPQHGFPIQAKRNYWGKVQPTTPLCYHVSSTAAQTLNKAMVRCDERLMQWRDDGYDAHMILTIHDELVFDLPLTTLDDYTLTDRRANELRAIMEASSVDGIGIHVRVSVERHAESWADGVVVPRV